MKVLVTGGAGYIGSVAVGALSKAGHDVLVLDNLTKGHDVALRGAPLAVVDIREGAAVFETCSHFAPDACMHFAAVSLVGESVENPVMYYDVNLGGSINLLAGLAAAGCRAFVFSSTAATYGQPESTPIDEMSPTFPVNPYGHTKLAFERVLAECEPAIGLSYASLRYFNAAGADIDADLGEDHTPESHLIPLLIRAALGHTTYAEVLGTDYPTPDGTCVRDYIHVSDLAAAHLLALEYLLDGGPSAIFNLGNGSGFSVREVIESVKRISGREFEVVERPRRPGDPPELVASSERIARQLGWKPSFPRLDSIVETAWRWHSLHPGGYSG